MKSGWDDDASRKGISGSISSKNAVIEDMTKLKKEVENLRSQVTKLRAANRRLTTDARRSSRKEQAVHSQSCLKCPALIFEPKFSLFKIASLGIQAFDGEIAAQAWLRHQDLYPDVATWKSF